MYAMTAAHKTLPIPSYARVRNPAEIEVRRFTFEDIRSERWRGPLQAAPLPPASPSSAPAGRSPLDPLAGP